MNPTVETGALDEALARISSQYDDLPYESKPVTKSHPALIAGVARLFGLDAPKLETARVLELGCADGGNIIPHAARFPRASFLGIDIGARQIGDGQARISAHKLKNIELRCQSLTEFTPDEGAFDYIIAHGVYSWVPAPVREALLRICRENLAPNGIAFISYNVNPGWRMHQPLRDAFRLMIPDALPARDRARMARELLEFMKQFTADSGIYGSVLRDAPGRLAEYPDDYLFHEYMEDTNQSFTYSDFINAAQRHGLGFLGECDINLMVPESFGSKFAEAVRRRTTGDTHSVEQMMDLLTGRTFRQTLLVPKARVPEISRNLTPASLGGLHIMAPRGMKLEREGDAVTLTDDAGRQLSAGSAAVAVALERMIDKFPASVTLAECGSGLDAGQRSAVADAAFSMLMAGMIQVSTVPLPAGKPGKLPKATSLARGDAMAGRRITANFRHEPAMIDAAGMEILPLLNGKNDRERLANRLVEAVSNGRLTIAGPSGPVRDDGALRTAARNLVPQLLNGLANSGLIES